jgi:hypothetical protein
MDLSIAATLLVREANERVITHIDGLKKSAAAEKSVVAAIGSAIAPDLFNETGSIVAVQPVGQLLSKTA